MHVTILETDVIDAPPERVWGMVRDFNSLPAWHPIVEASEIEDGRTPSEVGCVRRYVRRDGLVLREQLLGLDDDAYSCAYRLLTPPFPVDDYLARMAIFPLLDTNKCFFKWTASFACDSTNAVALKSAVSAVFKQGISSLQRIVAP